MDVERTIEFILKTQAKTEVRMDGITKLLLQGMRMLVKTTATVAELSQAQKRTDARLTVHQKRTDARIAEVAHAPKLADVQLAELAQAQTEAQRSLKAFIDSLRQGRNGRQAR